MTPGLVRRLAAPALAALVVAGSAAAFAQAPPSSTRAPVPPPPFAVTADRAESGVRWQSLTPAQRRALAPLERDWSGIDAQRKQKWVQIADRYPSLPPQEQARIAERMNDWARLTPAQRGEMRLRYQESQQVRDRSAKWQEYQNLPPESRQQFADRAAAVSSPPRPDPFPGSRPSAAGRDASQAKANLVPNPDLAQRPKPVAPTVVQAAPGATTRFVTRPATPPEHQQSGMPKITATPEFINRSTLLPKRGPQAAAVAPVPPPPRTPDPKAKPAEAKPAR
jgi:hypothetical protein